MTNDKSLRTIPSFVRRNRMTSSQARALVNLLPNYEYKNGNDFPKLNQNTYLDIGFGNGASLVGMAQSNPDSCFLGIEIHKGGVGRLLLDAHDKQLPNIRIINDDAVEILYQRKLPMKFNGIYLLFPDPWPKKKHHKRRIFTAEFAQLAASYLKPNGYLFIATDWQHYAEEIIETMGSIPDFRPNLDPAAIKNYIERPATKYEFRGLKLNHKVWELLYTLKL